MLHKVAQQLAVAREEPLAKGASRLPCATLHLVCVYFRLVQQEVAQQRHQRHGNDERTKDQERNGQAEILEDHTCKAVRHAQRQEHRHGGERRGGQRQHDLFCSLHTARHSVMPLACKTIDVLQHDNGVIHDHADAHGDAAQRQQVHRQVADVHQHKHRQDAYGHRNSDSERCTESAQE